MFSLHPSHRPWNGETSEATLIRLPQESKKWFHISRPQKAKEIAVFAVTYTSSKWVALIAPYSRSRDWDPFWFNMLNPRMIFLWKEYVEWKMFLLNCQINFFWDTRDKRTEISHPPPPRPPVVLRQVTTAHQNPGVSRTAFPLLTRTLCLRLCDLVGMKTSQRKKEKKHQSHSHSMPLAVFFPFISNTLEARK